ncbi:MAG: hypothetical protein LLF96_11385 [Eubacteriales bacterium]|nr:hypothetical protein [Eubacteriales bacterium]
MFLSRNALIVIGLVLSFIGTLISVIMIISVSLPGILRKSTYNFLGGGISKEAALQKCLATIGIMILLCGTMLQIIGTISSPTEICFYIIYVTLILLITITCIIAYLKYKSNIVSINNEIKTSK